MSGTVETTEPTTDGLVRELAGYRDLFNQAKSDIEPLLEGLTDDVFNERPDGDRWSVAECLDHLCVTGSLILPKVDEGIQKAETNGWKSDGPFTYGFVGNWFVSIAGPSEKARRRKLPAPRIYTPTSNHSVSRLRTTFVDLQDQIIERIHRANGWDLARVKVPSPVTRFLRLSLGQWFALLAGHQQRHFLQAMDVRNELEGRE